MGFGLAGALGSVLDAGVNIWSAVQQNKAAQASAAKEMDFQASQSGSVYQRGVADLKAAGLNPILAAGGATDPAASGAMYNPVPVGMNAVSDAVSTAKNVNEVNAVRAGIDSTKANTDLTKTKVATEAKSQELMDAQKSNALLDTVIKNAQAWSAKNRLRVEQEHPDLYGRLDAIMPRLAPVAGTALDMAGTGSALKYILGGKSLFGSKGPTAKDVGSYYTGRE